MFVRRIPYWSKEAANPRRLAMILHELRDFRRDNSDQLKDIKENIQKTNERLEEAEERIVGLEERSQNTESVMAEVLKLQTQLEERITDQEGRSRRNNIRIYGVVEGAEGNSPSMIAFIGDMLREKLELDTSLSFQIERAHRALAPRPPENAPPRSIVVNFLSYRMKEEILRSAWRKKGFVWQDRKVNIDHDYAPEVLRKRKEYNKAKKLLKEKMIQFQTPFPAKLRVFFPRCDPGVFDDSVLVMEGDSATLKSPLPKMKDHDVIEWLFKDENTLIAEIHKQADRITVYDDVLDGRFRDRLKLDNQTGSLTITHTTMKHDGDYQLHIHSGSKRFRLIVFARLPVPVISRDCSSSSSSSCSLVCSSSVVNVSHVTLSWYAGMSVLSSISVCDLSISLSLPLEVEYQDKNTYSCVLNNPISNQTTHLDINTLCRHTCEDSVHCCGPTEAVIRLVLSALVGVATVIILVYDIRSRRAERDQAHIHTSET
ncbi:uncharacterized protein LOC120486756 [Pimephales promelas]|uniref:uncharacterized protein LOC120486756 n=1 Tax=Pimephales promelas TaxID=90988 RepID=UPI0019555EEA|nr:uncharacterized protein LOC120486756 [Pimephales promelas]